MDYSKPLSNKIPEGYSFSGSPVRVMIVDDDVVVRKIVMQIVRSVGYAVVGEATNGVDAVDSYKIFKPDIVIMDVRMPKLDGFGALKQIIAFDKDAAVIMLSTESDTETVTNILKAGAKNYLKKPVERTALIKRLRSVREISGK